MASQRQTLAVGLFQVLGGQLYGHFGGHSVWLVSAALALLSIPLINQATRSSASDKLEGQTRKAASFS